MDFAFSLNAFRSDSLEAGVEAVADAGYDGVEILLDDPHLVPGEASDDELASVRDLLAEHDLAVANCNAFMLAAIEAATDTEATYDRDTEPFHHPSFVEPHPEDRRRRIEHTKRALETADALGADSISITPGGPVPAGTEREDALDVFVQGLREVLPTAEDVGVDVLVEPEPDLLIESSEQFLELVDRVDSPRLGCNFDAGHFFCVGEDPAELVDVLGEHTPHYHLEDIPADRTHVHTQLGEGGLDVEGFLSAVEDSGYDGFVTVELYPYEETAAETAVEAMAYLEAHGWA